VTDYTLTRSKRRTVALYVRDGVVEVRAPLKVPKRDIDEFVASKQKWIADKLAQSAKRVNLRNNFSLTYGDTVTYRGKQYEIAESSRIGVSDNYFYVRADLTPEQIKADCVKIYKILAQSDLNEKVRDFAAIMGVTPTAVRINGANTRWGSCSAKKSLNFSWRLIMADDDVIDYVVVHELAHITEMNHSSRFWAVVSGVLPDYRERQKRLKELQKRLNAEDWE